MTFVQVSGHPCYPQSSILRTVHARDQQYVQRKHSRITLTCVLFSLKILLLLLLSSPKGSRLEAAYRASDHCGRRGGTFNERAADAYLYQSSKWQSLSFFFLLYSMSVALSRQCKLLHRCLLGASPPGKTRFWNSEVRKKTTST